MTTQVTDTALDLAKEFLLDTLAAGPCDDLKRKSELAGHSESTTRRALKELAEAEEIEAKGAPGRPLTYSLAGAAASKAEPAELERAFQTALNAAVYAPGSFDPRLISNGDFKPVRAADGSVVVAVTFDNSRGHAGVIKKSFRDQTGEELNV